MKKILILITLIIMLANCKNKEKQLPDAEIDVSNKIDIELILKKSIDYDEPYTVSFYRKKLFAEEGDLKGFLSVSVGRVGDGSYLHFPTEESRKSFVDFIKYSRLK